MSKSKLQTSNIDIDVWLDVKMSVDKAIFDGQIDNDWDGSIKAFKR